MQNISIGLAILLALVLAYAGVYLAVGRFAEVHRKRIAAVLCFAGSAIALLVAIYIASGR
jgi:hypothetical protein